MKSTKGFTLIELIITLGLAGIIITVVMSFFTTNMRSYETISTTSELQYESQHILNFMNDKILEAKEFDDVNDEFKDIDGNVFKFYKNDNDEMIYAYKEVDSNLETIIGRNVSYLNITVSGSNNVIISLALQKKRSEDYSAKQTVFMRNAD